MVNETSCYTDPANLEAEQRALFRGGPVFFALSCELRQPGAYQAATFGGVPLLVVRQGDGSLRAMVNICRHRGAPLVPPMSTGHRPAAISCPYHAWTYELDGRLRARPMAGDAFSDVGVSCDLPARAVAEKYGMIFVRADDAEPIDVDGFLSGAEDDLGAFDLDGYVHLETRENTWDMNWKLILDTFTESYHIRTLHKDSIAPAFNSDSVIYEGFGRHLMSIGLRKNVLDELAKPREEWSIIPYGTMQYFLVPNALVVHQLDHVEVWRVEPIDVNHTRTRTSMYAPGPEVTEKAERYFIKNLDLLLSVTGTEDFPMMEQIQANMESGAIDRLVYGKNEAPLIHFHTAINEAVAAATPS